MIIVGLIACLAWMTRIYQRRIEPAIGTNATRRLSWIGGGTLIFIVLCLLESRAGLKSNIITALSTATLVLLACVAGHWLAGHLKRPSEFIPIGVAVALSDIFSVVSGPTRTFAANISDYYREGMTGAAPLVDFFLVKMPMSGNDYFMPVFGITDWVVVALLSAGALRFRMNDNLFSLAGSTRAQNKSRAFFPVAGIGLIISIVAARSMHLYLPALPFIVIGFLGVMAAKYPAVRKLRPDEIRAMILVSALIGSFMVVFAFMKI
ncbi:hypothetical protein [Desulfobacter latus]|uniref:Uncharacterized protein n=1 Tax=Desulfobacter latus TaxID=2292 RepID=A0A850T4D5_9BACT|nr:hypothetical protein [Desulfobacter latus]NWH03695.1 hypothetical protein [Desulfobacter latus]